MSQKWRIYGLSDSWLFGTIGGWICIIFLVIVIGTGITVFALRLDTSVVQPEVKVNKLHSADASISNTNRYHTELHAIITADSNLITLLKKARGLEQSEPGTYQQDSRYSELINIQLPGLEQARSDAISTYDADASNSNYNMDLPHNYPHTIALQAIPDDTGSAIDLLNGESASLSVLS